MLHLLGMKRCSHVQILLVTLRNGIRRVVRGMSWLVHDSLIGWIVFIISAKSHLSLEINFCLLITLLSIPQLSVPTINKVVASSDVVVTIVLNTLLSVLAVEVELIHDFVK